MAPRYFLAWTLYTALYLAVGADQPQYALKGESVVLKPNIVGQPDSILWKHGGNKVVEFNGKEEQVFGKYENRITLDWLSAQVTISDLRLEDSGEYELEVDINDRLYRSSYQLVVMEKVSIPSIKCEMTNGSRANVSAQLLCTAEPKQPQSLMKFEWRAHGGMQDGPWLRIPLGGIHDDEVYTCSVSNPLSSEKAKYMAKDCYPVESSSLTAILVTVSLVLLVLLVSGFLLYMYRSQVCKCFQKDVEKGPRLVTKTGSRDLNAQGEEKNSLLPNKDSSQDAEAFDESIEVRTPPKRDVKDKVQMFEELTSPIKDEPQKTSPHDSSLPGVVTSPLTQNNPPSIGQGDVVSNQQNEPKEKEKPSAPKRGKKLNHQRSPPIKDESQKTSTHDSSLHSGVTSQTTLNNISSKGQGDVVTNQQNETKEEEKPSDHGGQETSPCDSSQGQGDVVTDQHDKEEEKSSDPQRGNESQPAVVTEDLKEDTQSVVKPPIPPKQPDTDEPQKTSPHDSSLPGGVTSPTTQNNLPSKGQGDVDTDQQNETKEEEKPSDPEMGNELNHQRTLLKKDGGQETSPCDSSQGEGDVVTDQHDKPKEEGKPSDPERGTEPQPAVVTEDLKKDTQSVVKPPIPPKQPAFDESIEARTPPKRNVKEKVHMFEGDTPLQKDEPQKTSTHDSSLHSGVTSPLTQNNLPSKGQSDVVTNQQNESEEEEKPSGPEMGNELNHQRSPLKKDGGQETSCDSSQGEGDVVTNQQNEPKEEGNPSDHKRGNEPPPASVTEDLKEDTHSDLDLTSKQPDPQKKADEEAQSAPAGPEPQSPLVSSSPDTASKDRAGEHKGDTDLDQVAEKTFKESDTSDKEERSESDDSIKHKQSSTMPEQNGSEEALQEHNLNMSQEEAQADTMSVKTAKPVSENESKTDSISEETDKEQDMYSSPVQKAQSPAQDHRNTPDQPDQTAGQSEKGESEVQCDFKEETPRSESCREDEDGQSKDKVTASSILANTKKL